MKRVISTVILLIMMFCLTGCATARSTQEITDMIEKESGTNIVVKSAAGRSPDFYPGAASDIITMHLKEYQEYCAVHKEAIQAIGTRALVIKTGNLPTACIGIDLFTCIASLSKTLAVATESRSWQYLTKNDPLTADKTDVTGKTLFNKDIRFVAYVPGWQYDKYDYIYKKLSYNISLGDDRKVTRVSIIFPRDPLHAQTKEEYDATGLYEGLAPLLNINCPDLTRDELYKVFETEMKAALGARTTQVSSSIHDVGITEGQIGKIQFCGKSLTFSSSVGRSTSMISEHNTSGIYGGGLISIEEGYGIKAATASTTPQARPQIIKQHKPLGISFMPVTDVISRTLLLGATKGVFVAKIQQDSIAQQAGFHPSDVVLKYGDNPIMTNQDLQQAVSDSPEGVAIPVIVYRYGWNGVKGSEIILQVQY